MANIPVDWGVLMLNHPSYRDIRDKVSGIPEDWETYCIQMSYALNKAGARIKNTGKNVGFIEKGDNYIINVPKMREYLNEEYGEAEKFERSGAANSRIAIISQIVDRTGIIAFGDRHIDLWNKDNLQRPSDYIMSALWEAKSAMTKGIFFWEVSK
ncbi:MAG TPA: T6SS effector amidase Tae4 family protein [Pyrinomonadaceae bacterium]|nr:T6SS effector amidase Tae4 family protein [Pyrinomonadaceae bacterium]